MAGALIGHMNGLGWEGPRLELGILAIVVLACCTTTLLIRSSELPLLGAIQTDKPTKPFRRKK